MAMAANPCSGKATATRPATIRLASVRSPAQHFQPAPSHARKIKKPGAPSGTNTSAVVAHAIGTAHSHLERRSRSDRFMKNGALSSPAWRSDGRAKSEAHVRLRDHAVEHRDREHRVEA